MNNQQKSAIIKESQSSTISGCIKEVGIKGFMKRWKEGFNKIPPDKLLESEIIGYWANILGTIFATVLFAIWSKMWPLALVMGFNLIIQFSQLAQKYQQLNQMKLVQDAFKNFNPSQ